MLFTHLNIVTLLYVSSRLKNKLSSAYPNFYLSILVKIKIIKKDSIQNIK